MKVKNKSTLAFKNLQSKRWLHGSSKGILSEKMLSNLFFIFVRITTLCEQDMDPSAIRAYVVRPVQPIKERNKIPELRLQEAVSLTEALGPVKIVGSELVQLRKANPSTFFGSGKIEELRNKMNISKANLLVIDSQITPVQLRSISNVMENSARCQVVDRYGIILEIFSKRAETRVWFPF